MHLSTKTRWVCKTCNEVSDTSEVFLWGLNKKIALDKFVKKDERMLIKIGLGSLSKKGKSRIKE